MAESGVLGTLLIVDDEAYVRESLRLVLERRGFQVRTSEGGSRVWDPGTFDGLDAVITDLRMPGQDGLQLIRQIKKREPRLPVIVLTAYGDVPSAVECIKAGAYEFLEKPADNEQLVHTLERALRESTMTRELEYLRTNVGTGSSSQGPVGESEAWKRIVETVEMVAPTDTTVLLLGESGTGKEEVARLIHRKSLRKDRSFVGVNCAAVPLDLFESEFFGHRKGAFTGATRDRDGYFRVADKGTLFLDEIVCLPEAAQSKVLRVLEGGEFQRVGETKVSQVNVRLICATNIDLETEVKAGHFRQDLFYRINVLTIQIPPLRKRPEDIGMLSRLFLERCCLKVNKKIKSISPEVMQIFVQYTWPGNIRELRNVIERSVILEKGDTVTPGSLPDSLQARAAAEGEDKPMNLRKTLAAEEKRVLLRALRSAHGVRRQAAAFLGIDERNLSYYLKKHELENWKPDA